MEVRREIEVEASPEEVWEALATEEGRERWLGEPERDIHIESQEALSRLTWWWASEEQPATRVEFQIVELPRVEPAVRAPRRPELHQNHLALQRLVIESLARQGLRRERGRLL